MLDVLNRLPNSVLGDIKDYVNCIKVYLSNLDISYDLYLFGSIAKFNYNEDSDIDLLLIVDKDFSSIKECKKFKYSLLYDMPCLDRELDLKVYSKNKFFSTDNFFENDIKKDLVKVG